MKRKLWLAVAVAVLGLGATSFFLLAWREAPSVQVSERDPELPQEIKQGAPRRAGGAAKAPMVIKPSSPPLPTPAQPPGSEHYEHEDESGFELVSATPLSTFSVDTDTASYSNVRRFTAPSWSSWCAPPPARPRQPSSERAAPSPAIVHPATHFARASEKKSSPPNLFFRTNRWGREGAQDGETSASSLPGQTRKNPGA